MHKKIILLQRSYLDQLRNSLRQANPTPEALNDTKGDELMPNTTDNTQL